MSQFVSGLPLTDAEREVAGVADAHGIELLQRIRARARREADALAPATIPRFDGAERLAPDPDAVEAKADYDALTALCNGIFRDRVLLLRLAALLGKVRL